MKGFDFSGIKIPKFDIPDMSNTFSSVKIPDITQGFSSDIPDFDTSIPSFDTDKIISDTQNSFEFPDISTDIDISKYTGKQLEFPKLDNIGMSKTDNSSSLFSKVKIPKANSIFKKNENGFNISDSVKNMFPDLSEIFKKSGISDIFKNIEFPEMGEDLKIPDMETPSIDPDKLDLDMSKAFDISSIDFGNLFKKK